MRLRAVIIISVVLLPGILLSSDSDGDYTPAQQSVLDSLSVWHNRSRPDLVDSLATLVLPEAKAADDSSYFLQLLLHSGRTQAAFGMAQQAEPKLQEVCFLAAATGDTTVWLKGLRWLSVAMGRQGRSTEAVAIFHKLNNLANAAGDSIHVGWAELGLAYDHYLNGRSQQAIAGYGQAAGILDRAGISRGALWAYNGQGLALRQVGQFDAAIRCFKHTLELAIANQDKLSEAMSLNYIGRLEMMFGDPALSIQHFQRSAAIHQQLQHHREGLLPLLDIAQAMTMQGRFEEAVSNLDTIIDQTTQWGLADLELLAVRQLADIHLACGRAGTAALLCRRAMARDEFPSAMARTELNLCLAQALAGRDSLEEALAVLEPVSKTEPAATILQLRISRRKSSYLMDLGLYEQALDCALAGSRQARTAGLDLMLLPLQTLTARAWFALGARDSALAVVNRAANQWDRVRSLPSDPRWREIRSEIASELFTQGAMMAMAQKNGTGPVTGIQWAFDFIQRYKARTLVERIHGPDPLLEAAPNAISLHEIQTRILDRGDVFWEVVADKSSSVFVLVTQEKVLGHVIEDNSHLVMAMLRLTDVLTSKVISDPQTAQILAANLVEDLPASFREILQQARRIVWSPDGLWHGLPLALLRGSASKNLISTNCELARVPAASFLEPRDHVGKDGLFDSEILILSGPIPGNGKNSATIAKETGWLEDHFQQVRIGSVSHALASGGSQLSTAGLIHVAAHTEIDAQQPWNTSIVLGEDGKSFLKADDIAHLELDAALAVLASCRTAGSRTISGEGMLGLTSAFLASGVSSVVATLWPVDDEATAVFMAHFYSGLADGHDVSGALRLAQEACVRDSAMASARYWAGFVVVGDGSCMVPLQRKPARWPVAAGFLLLAAGFVWRGRRLAR